LPALVSARPCSRLAGRGPARMTPALGTPVRVNSRRRRYQFCKEITMRRAGVRACNLPDLAHTQPHRGGNSMRKILLTLVLFAAARGSMAATPSKASAAWWRGSRYYSYYPSYYYSPVPAYTYYNVPYTTSYYAPTYYAPAPTSYYYTPTYSSYYYTPAYASYYTPAYTSYYYTPAYRSYYYSPGVYVYP